MTDDYKQSLAALTTDLDAAMRDIEAGRKAVHRALSCGDAYTGFPDEVTRICVLLSKAHYHLTSTLPKLAGARERTGKICSVMIADTGQPACKGLLQTADRNCTPTDATAPARRPRTAKVSA